VLQVGLPLAGFHRQKTRCRWSTMAGIANAPCRIGIYRWQHYSPLSGVAIHWSGPSDQWSRRDWL